MAKTLTVALAITGSNSAISGNSQIVSYLELTGASEIPISFVSGPIVAVIAAGATATFTPPAGGWTGDLDFAVAMEYVAAVPLATLTLDATALILRRQFVGVMDTSLTITNSTASEATATIIFWKAS